MLGLLMGSFWSRGLRTNGVRVDICGLEMWLPASGGVEAEGGSTGLRLIIRSGLRVGRYFRGCLVLVIADAGGGELFAASHTSFRLFH